ncbi:unnamed protein product [Prorocentrum cordatum]|uniref:Uncharacterized protein n=1 Tax=Prorocentrum cordatum TaxID=2364126 RepID=A0ABN9VQ19_9DINO|nr:unnamed protein product [Polarella glacialis]
MATRKEVTVRYEEQQCTLLLVEGAEPEALSSALFAKLGIQGMSPYLTEVGSDAVVPLTAALPAGMILEAHARHTLRPPKQRLPRQRLGTVSIDESRARTRSRLDSGGTDDADADLQRRADSPSKGWTSAAAGGAADRGPETRSRTGTFSSPSQIPSPSKRPGDLCDPGAATAPLLAPSSASPPPPPRLNQACEHDVAAEVFQPGRRPVVPGQDRARPVRISVDANAGSSASSPCAPRKQDLRGGF